VGIAHYLVYIVSNILFVTQQSIMDPGSGAAVSNQSFATLLASAGHQVHSICTTQTEHHLGIKGHEHYLQQTYALQHEEDLWQLHLHGISYEFIKSLTPSQVTTTFLTRFELTLQLFCPDVIVTFGDTSVDQKIRYRANQLGVKVIFTLHNTSYANKAVPHVQHYICPSNYLREFYSELKSNSSTIYPPLDPKLVECDPSVQQRVFLTYVNPVLEKGLLLAVAIFHTLLNTRPDIPIFVVEGRGNAQHLLKACAATGLDLNEYDNLYISTAPMSAKEIMQHTRLLIMPSVIDEAAGRVAMEAMYNGIPALVSDKGALPEIVGSSECVVALPPTLTLSSRHKITPEDAQPWVDKILSYYAEDESYIALSQQVKQYAKEHYHPNVTLLELKKVLDTLNIT
jgi:glycosyltransferase involved in cell wall biosynthesis